MHRRTAGLPAGPSTRTRHWTWAPGRAHRHPPIPTGTTSDPRRPQPHRHATIDPDTESPGRYYFRTVPLFETGSDNYARSNDIVRVGSGYSIDGRMAHQVSRIRLRLLSKNKF
ncbi:DUF3237 family protein [Nocardia sp. NPDC006044]|uniref:DUF3237 family protein n=1 Tax=Nocardia sp. NPDC006044 TaxID=3364306 RepID=UPI00369283B6